MTDGVWCQRSTVVASINRRPSLSQLSISLADVTSHPEISLSHFIVHILYGHRRQKLLLLERIMLSCQDHRRQREVRRSDAVGPLRDVSIRMKIWREIGSAAVLHFPRLLMLAGIIPIEYLAVYKSKLK